MKWLLGMLSIGLTSLGGLFLLVSIILTANTNAPKTDQDAALRLFILAVPSLVGGSAIAAWPLYSQRRRAKQAQQQAEAEQLRKLFYELVLQHQGRLTVLQFAAVANISGNEAKQYLDAQAREFGADFTVEADGETTYLFPL